MAYQADRPQSSYLNEEAVREADPQLYERIRKHIGVRYLRVSVQAGGPLNASESELGEELARSLRAALETPTHGNVTVYFRAEKRKQDAAATLALVRWLHYSRGHSGASIGLVLRINPEAMSRKYLTAGAARDVPMTTPFSDEAVAAGLPYVEQRVLGIIRQADVPVDERIKAIAARTGTTPEQVRKRCWRAGAVVMDLNTLKESA